jgi:hypothetical protein
MKPLVKVALLVSVLAVVPCSVAADEEMVTIPKRQLLGMQAEYTTMRNSYEAQQAWIKKFNDSTTCWGFRS